MTTRRNPLPLLPPLPRLAMVVLLGLLVTGPGCRRPPQAPKDDTLSSGPKGDPWEVLARRLKKETDYVACKNALSDLANNLAAQDNATRLPGLTPDAEAALTRVINLIPGDREEIRGASFSSHDPVYLADCLYLRDAWRSLDLPGLTPDQMADLGFAWVCRQVYLNPWLHELEPGLKMGTAVPPTYVLRRGYGSGLERMYVFLALLQQMGLDGCLVGPPEAGTQPAGLVALGPDEKTVLTGTPRGPFWAVGVRLGSDIRLYDPWRGTAFPASFQQMKANPEAYKDWFDDPANTSGASVAEMKKATLFLAVPVNALAPRMATLEKKLKEQKLEVRLALDPVAMQAAFPDPKPSFWNPPTDRLAYLRVGRGFLPTDLGGADSSPPSPLRLYESYIRDMLPAGVLQSPEQIRDSEDAAKRLRTAGVGLYLAAFFDPPNPRERVQRGQFQDAARDLVAKQDMFGKSIERRRNSPDAQQQIREWVSKAKDLYDELGRAGLITDREARATAIAAAATAIDNHWRHGAAVQLLVDSVVGEVGLAEATYLLALCKHEQAERAQARLEHAAGSDVANLKRDTVDAWKTALAEWRTYEGFAAAHRGFPGREAHAEMLKKRAEQLAMQK
jgi:hypothetical protein